MADLHTMDAAPRRLHTATLFFSILPIARGLVIPALVAGGLSARRDWDETFGWVILAFTSITLVTAAVQYWTFRYRVGDGELVLDSGFLYKQHRVIPFSRVQSIDIRQGLIQRLLGLAELRVQTASGGDAAEAELKVLAYDVATAMRDEILAGRSGPVIVEPGQPDVASAPTPAVSSVALSRLSVIELALAGATANQIGLIVAALGGVFSMVDDVPHSQLQRLLDGVTARLIGGQALGSLLAMLVAVVVVLFAAWVLSIVGTVVHYYDFSLDRTDRELRQQHGLLNRRSGTMPLGRVQALRVEESVLRRPLGFAALSIETAAAPEKEGKSSDLEAFVPLVHERDLSGLVAKIFGDFDYGRNVLRPVHPRSRRSAFTRYALLLVLAAAVLAVRIPRAAPVPLLLLPAAWYLARWQYRHRGYAVTPGYVVARAGAVNRLTWIVPTHKLQTLHLTESPLQRWRGLASVVLDTAAGGSQAVVRDLGRDDAKALMGSLMGRPRGH